MKCNINKNLVAFKVFLFCFVGAIGCCWPFLTLHMSQLGLTVEEIAVINLILPFMAAFCKPFIGIIADKTGRYKLIMSIMVFTTGIFFTLLLLIPPVEKPLQQHQKPTTHTFICSQDGALIQTPCNKLTNSSNWTILELTQCTSHCYSSYSPNFNPNLCLSSENTKTCISLKPEDRFIISVLFKETQTTSHQCRIQTSQMQGLLRELKCPYANRQCRAECMSGFAEDDAPLEERSSASVSLTFWLYMGVRSIAEMILSACHPLSDAINLTLTGRFGGSFGQQQMVGILALGIFAPVSGLVIDYVSEWNGSETYVSCFIMTDVMFVLSAVAIFFMPDLEIKKQNRSMFKGLKVLLTSEPVIVLFIVCFGMGIIWGYMEIFLYLYLLQNGGTRLLIGLTQFMSVVPSLPLLYKSMWILDKVGHVNLFIFSFFVYSVRCVGYVFLVNPWWALLLESTRIFSVYLPRIGFTIYADTLTTPELKVTTQSLVFLLHFDVGRGVGSLIGGTLKDYFGDITTFQIIAVYSSLFGCAYFALYYFYLKDKHANIPRKSTINTLKVQENDENKSTVQNGHVKSVEKPLLSSQC